MKKYLISLILSLSAGVLVFLFSFDSSGFSYILVIPVLIALVLPSLVLRIYSSKTFNGKHYWDMIMWPVWFVLMWMYGSFSTLKLNAGDNYWYANGLFVNRAISLILIAIPIIMLICLKVYSSKQETNV